MSFHLHIQMHSGGDWGEMWCEDVCVCLGLYWSGCAGICLPFWSGNTRLSPLPVDLEGANIEEIAIYFTNISEVLQFLPAATSRTDHELLRAPFRLVPHGICSLTALFLMFCKLQFNVLLWLHSPGTSQGCDSHHSLVPLIAEQLVFWTCGAEEPYLTSSLTGRSSKKLAFKTMAITQGCEMFKSLLQISFVLNRPALAESQGLRGTPQSIIQSWF